MSIPDTSVLRAQHDALERIVESLHHVIAQPQMPDAADLFRLRKDFTKNLVGHLTAEDWLLYPQLLQHQDQRIAALARTFVAEMGGLVDVFKAWSARWTADSIAVDWSGFCTDTAPLLAALAVRITRENTELYPLCEGDASLAA